MLIINGKYSDASFLKDIVAMGETVHAEEDDNAVVRRLHEESSKYGQEEHESRRLECTLLFDDITSWWQVLTLGLPDEISKNTDVMITTKDDLMAKTLLLRLPGKKYFPVLDRIPQRRNNNRTVHLVIFGSTQMAEALAVNAAFVAHYPNYCRNNRLRTRITIVDNDIFTFRDGMLQRYRNLFDHSYYRTLDLHDHDPHCVLHRPRYEGKRKDFVDIEWEFVHGNASSEAVRQKLSEWATMETQQLTVVICGETPGENTVVAYTMPNELNDNEVPILFQSFNSSGFNLQSQGNVIPFSDDICDIGTLMSLKQMAMRVNYIYNHCFSLSPGEPVAPPADINTADMERQWAGLSSFGKRYSNVLNAMTLGTKMHSVGLEPEDWNSYYALSKEEIQTLAEVEHNRWSVEELILGYRPVTDEEQALVERDVSLKRKLRERKIHYDLRAFDDLREDATGKNVAVYDQALSQGIPLILKTCITD